MTKKTPARRDKLIRERMAATGESRVQAMQAVALEAEAGRGDRARGGWDIRVSRDGWRITFAPSREAEPDQ